MWLTDRTRYVHGLGHCQAARYYNFHYQNTGIVRQRASIPLATGIYVHEVLAALLQHAQRTGKVAGREVTRAYIKNSILKYKEEVSKSGFIGVADLDTDYLIEEQSCLIAGLVWGYWQMVLPNLLNDFEIVDVEREETYVVCCSCGVGDGTPLEAHTDCNGICWMSRPDALVRSKVSKKLHMIDFKTTSMTDNRWISQWNDNLQMAVSSLGAEVRLGEKVEAYWIHGINKGGRKSEYDSNTRGYDGPVRQNSILCHAYFKNPSPPLDHGDWQPSYKYIGEDGKNHTLPRTYSKQPIWTGYFHEKLPEMDNIEYWVSMLPPQVVANMYMILGPYQRHNRIIDNFLKEMPGHETEWAGKLIKMFYTKTSQEEVIYRSWNCHSFYGDCPYLPICYNHPGHDQLYVPRLPHHTHELEQFKDRGIDLSTSMDTEVGE